ncbi:MAG: hypothetical protein Q9209_006425 [Squamulea sp. 1 TL-2023]
MPSAAKLFFLAVFTLFQSSHANDLVKSVQSAPSELCAVRHLAARPHLLASSSQFPQINPKAIVSDACASYSTLDNLNTALAPSLKDITQSTDFFAYYRLNLYDQKCPVTAWDDETGTCGNIACKVDTLENEKDIPLIWRASELSKLEGPKAAHPGRQLQKERGSQRPLQGTLGENVGESCVVEYDDECDERDYCIPEDESATAKGDYVSLVDNPERYTGYAGQPVWDAIYRENCFFKTPASSSISSPPLSNPFNSNLEAAAALRNVIQAGTPKSEFILDDSCLEKRVFHRIISGMHASISTHICADYLNQTTGQWGPNLQCYANRLATQPERVSNLYFNYALLLRAVTKLRTYLKNYTFCSGDVAQDATTKAKILHLADSAAAQPRIFDESIMFQDPHDAGGLKEDFRNRFRNVSRLMDCVGCDKCRLWGKLQTVGYGTALKVLFEYEEDKNGENPPLRRTELVALVNTLDRVARSLTALGEMRALVLARESASSPSLGPKLDVQTAASSSPSSSPVNDDSNSLSFDDLDDSDEPSSSEDESILSAFKEEFSLVFRTLGYVLRSWIEFPSKVIQITVLEASRAWSFWLGLPVQPRNYVWEFGSGAPGREKGEL